MKVTLIGVDLAKTIFQVCGVNDHHKVSFNKAIRRHKFLDFLSTYPDAVIAMEACGGSNYWGRTLKSMGYKVMLIPPQHVKPFVKGNKNDRNDAFAITEAAKRPNLSTVEPRTIEQTDLIQLHRVLERRKTTRTSLTNQIRGFLSEYGIVIAKGQSQLKQAIPELLDDAENGLSPAIRQLLNLLLSEWRQLEGDIKTIEKQITLSARRDEASSRLMGMKGVAEKISTAMVAHIGNAKNYTSGRHLSASLGLVPKEHSSGGKQSFGSITKRGNRYLRRLLIQGAWSVVRTAKADSPDRLSRWANQIVERRGKQKAVTAVANKMVRIMWAMLYYQMPYRA